MRAKIMLIGEAPGANEDKTGRPFCGAAGKILNELLASAKIKRKDIYLTNILKDRPPRNRPPQVKEIRACTPFLEAQIKIIKPSIICPLGNSATVFVFKKFGLEKQLKKISQIHGRVFSVEKSFGQLKIIPFYHPAVAVYNRRQLPVLKKDFQVLK